LSSKLLPDNHFVVVIGAFAIKQNAERFTQLANLKNMKARFEFNPNRGLYYVYTLTTSDKAQAMSEARRLREVTSYFDAWVYQGSVGSDDPQQKDVQSADIDPVTEQVVETVQPTVPEPTNDTTTQVKVKTPAVTSEGKKFLFRLYNATDNKVIDGKVDAIDVDRSRKITSLKANEEVYLESPKSTSGKVSLISNAFGFRKQQVDINYNQPEGENISVNPDDAIEVPFALVRLHKGEIVVMYNVFFYRDAAIMMPESRFEVNSLLEMMKENPKCKIAVHGHTNGSSGGKIISMGESKNFFSLEGSKEGSGSAKALSEARANIIRDYLIDNGIEPERMKIEAWGGKKPLYDKDSARAQENVRVEIEILED
jgi:outer membrane protein OmpA-like peptidoglycan-associated protein